MPDPITLTGTALTVNDVVAVARDGAAVALDPSAVVGADASRAAVERLIADGRAVYGVNTGFGALANIRIDDDKLLELQRNLIVSHVAGVGDPLPVEAVRATMLLRANVLLKPTSGVRSVVPRTVVEMLNAGIHPVVPEQGSVGASGDLAPLSHIAYALMGQGDVMVGGGDDSGFSSPAVEGEVRRGGWSVVSAEKAFDYAGIAPVEFRAKEGLAFINGTQVQTALLGLAVHDATRLWRAAIGAAAMSLEAVKGTPVPFDARIHEARPHPGQLEVAALLRELLADSEIRESHRENDPRVQDAYSLRCTPQVLGAVADAIAFTRRVAETELNAATDNPLVFGDEVLSGGNFHGQPVALALDVLAIALTTLAGMSERRLERVVNPDLSQGLPPFLAQEPGLHSGMMMVQVTAAALVAEARTLSTPASVQSIPTESNQEDVVPMGMAAALKARRIVAIARRVVACELMVGAQGLEFRRPLRPGRGVAALYERVRSVVPALEADRPFGAEIEKLADLIGREDLA